MHLAAAASLGAQENSAGAGLSACVFAVVDLSDSGDNAQFQQIIREQLELELSGAGFATVPAARWQAARDQLGYSDVELTEGTKAIAVGEALDVQVVVTGFYRIEGGRIVLELKAYDVLQRAFITGVLRTGTVDLSMYTLIDTAVARMLPEIRLFSVDPGSIDVQQVKEITLFSQDEDAEVYLAGEQFVGRVRQGALTLPYFPLAVGSTIRVVTRKEGYYPHEQEIAIREPRVEETLKRLTRRTRWATELTWTTNQLLGFGLAQRWYPLPDILFLALEHDFYLQHGLTAADRAVIHNDLTLLVGGYPFSPVDAAFRLGLSTGLGMIVTYFTLPDQPVFTDFYWSVINTFVEWNFPRLTLFLGSEMKYAFGAGTNLLSQGIVGEGGFVSLGAMWKW